MKQPWHKLPKETSKAFAAFKIYRDLGRKRSARAVADALGHKATRHLNDWSASNRWVARAAAWDEHQDRAEREAALDAAREMAVRHALIAKGLTAKVAAWVQQLTEKDIAKWKPSDAARALEVAVKVERLSRGEPTDRTESVNTDARSDDVRELLQDRDARRMADELLAKIANAQNQ